jgi:hypothetical protein
LILQAATQRGGGGTTKQIKSLRIGKGGARRKKASAPSERKETK